MLLPLRNLRLFNQFFLPVVLPVDGSVVSTKAELAGS